MKAAECPTVYGGDLWDGVPRVSLAADHRHDRQRSQACTDCVNLSALPGTHVFAATQDVDGRDKPGQTTLTSPENALIVEMRRLRRP